MPLEAILFDMDGVIVDTMGLHFKASEKVLGKGIRRTTKDRNLLYLTDEEAYTRLLGSPGSQRVKKLVEEKYEYMREKTRGIKPIQGFFEFFFTVKGRYPLAVVSNSQRAFITYILGEIGEENAFDAIVGAEDIARGKPDPQGYLLAAKRLGKKPGECLVIEDSVYGIMAAKAAGTKVVAVTNTHDRNLLLDADLIVDSLAELTPQECEALFHARGK